MKQSMLHEVRDVLNIFNGLHPDKLDDIDRKISAAYNKLDTKGKPNRAGYDYLSKIANQVYAAKSSHLFERPKINKIRELLNKFKESTGRKNSKVGAILRSYPELGKPQKPFEFKKDDKGSYHIDDEHKLVRTPMNDDHYQPYVKTYQIHKHDKQIPGSEITVDHKGTPYVSGMFPNITGKNLAPNIYQVLNRLHNGITSDEHTTLEPAQKLWKRLYKMGLAEPMVDKKGVPVLNTDGRQRYKMFYNNITKNTDRLKSLINNRFDRR